MKTIQVGLILLGFVSSTLAIEKSELDERVRTMTAKFEEFQQRSDKAIPAEQLRKAVGVVLLQRTKAGFIFAYQGGGGLALVKDAKTQKWGPAAFLAAHEGSLGFQIGGQQAFFVILIMNTNALRMLTESNFEVGGEARGTAGDQTTAAGISNPPSEPSVLVYDDTKGLYGGAAVKAGAVTPDDEANRVYYGQALSTEDILFKDKVKPTEDCARLAAKIADYSKKTK